jgi:hypothetical protein
MALIEYMRRRSRLLFAGATWQFAAEAVLPINAVSGHGLGVRTQLLLFLDDLAPSLFGKPLPSQLRGTQRWTAFTNTGLRLLLRLPLLLLFLPFMPVEALGKGGTNMHELANTRHGVPTYQSPFPSDGFVGCGRGRYRDPRTHKCRGPADFGN